jgi:hypothetical protein
VDTLAASFRLRKSAFPAEFFGSWQTCARGGDNKVSEGAGEGTAKGGESWDWTPCFVGCLLDNTCEAAENLSSCRHWNAAQNAKGAPLEPQTGGTSGYYCLGTSAVKEYRSLQGKVLVYEAKKRNYETWVGKKAVYDAWKKKQGKYAEQVEASKKLQESQTALQKFCKTWM